MDSYDLLKIEMKRLNLEHKIQIRKHLIEVII